MALATQCPHCHTTFRVANDQLKLHAGIVRCGSCQQIFNGIEHLVAPGAAPAVAVVPAAKPEAEQAPLKAEPALAPAEKTEAAPVTADELDFDLGIFDHAPPAGKTFSAAETRQEPGLALAAEPSADAGEDAELQQRMALLAAAEADWSVSDDGINVAVEEPPEDTPLAPDAEDFQAATQAGLVSESALASAMEAESRFEPEFAADFLSEFEAVFEKELKTDTAQDDERSVSLAEPETATPDDAEVAEAGSGQDLPDELPPEAHPAEAGHIDEVTELETLDGDAEQALEAASIHAELMDEQASSLSEPEEAPDFVVQAQRKQARSKAARITMAILSVVLFLGVLAQLTYTMRNQLAAWFPQARPMLADACKPLNCQISLLAQIDAVSIESNELQAMAPDKNVFSLTLLLRNKGSTTQAWPMLELTLDNDKEQPVLRKVFTPAEYLANKGDLVKGFAGSSEQPVKLYFELEKIKAAGYHVWLFYP